VLQYAHNAYNELIVENKVEDIKFFMLWDDEDPACQLAASIAQENKILAYNLTDGLIMIPLNSEPISKPVQTEIPVAEEVVDEVPIVEVILVPEELEEAYEDEESEEGLEYDLGELMTLAIEQAGKVFARSFAEEFIKLLKK
jgi:glycerophosphoryl diester phosphodiesterase